MKTLLSLFDYSGGWSQPYWDSGQWEIYQFDIKHGHDINDFCCEYLLEELDLGVVDGILAAPPCTEFAVSGARWWEAKEGTGVVEYSVELVYQALRTCELFKPDFFAIENPVGRIESLIPEMKELQQFWFNPCDFGDPYTKKTGIWGNFTPPLPMFIGGDWSVEPTEGSKMHKQYGGKSEKTKTARSVTPPGFAKAFYTCNH